MLIDIDINKIIDGMDLERLNEFRSKVDTSITDRINDLNKSMDLIDESIHELLRDRKFADAIILLRRKHPQFSVMRAKEIIDWYLSK